MLFEIFIHRIIAAGKAYKRLIKGLLMGFVL